MTLQSKKPIVNKETFKANVTQRAAQLAFTNKPRAGCHVFSKADIKNLEAIFDRVSDLFGVLNTQMGLLSTEHKPGSLGQDLKPYSLVGRRATVERYKAYSSYSARAFNELIALTTHVAIYFDQILRPTPIHEDSPFIGAYVDDGYYRAELNTAGEGYHHARLEKDIQKFLYMLRPLDTSGLEPERINNMFVITDAAIDALSLVQTCLYLMKIYSTKKWKKEKI